MQTCTARYCKQPTQLQASFVSRNNRPTTTCSSCRDSVNRRALKRRRIFKENKLCRSCGLAIHDSDLVTCISCQTTRSAYRHAVSVASHEYLCSNPCSMCGETDPVVLDYDHLRDKTIDVSKIQSLALFYSEIEKCRVLCSICHRIHTESDRRRGVLSCTQSAIYTRNSKEKNKTYSDARKTEKGCENCGYNNPQYPCTLDWDHTDEHRSKKSNSIAYMYGLSRDAFDQEIRLCRVLCANCHRRRTYAQLNYKNHGEAPSKREAAKL